jgi:hypothetical protein
MHVLDFSIYRLPRAHVPAHACLSQCLVHVVSSTHRLVAIEAISVNLHTRLPTILLDHILLQPLTTLCRHKAPLVQVALGTPLQASAGSFGNKEDARGNSIVTSRIPRKRTELPLPQPQPPRPLRLAPCRDRLPFYNVLLLF